jgi:hypothetical protein
MTQPHRIFSMPFATLYPLYLSKVEKKGKTQAQLDRVLTWLTGYTAEGLQQVVADGKDIQTFFAEAPALNPNVGLIKGVVCGVRVEHVEDPLMQKIRWMDKLVDELARGKKMESILRA